jgi:hypothetical protein
VWLGTPTGLLLEIALDDIALELGLADTWSAASLTIGLVYAQTQSWIRNLLQFTVDNSIELILDRKLFSRRREYDKTITMEAAWEYSRKRNVLKAINTVRMALRIVWLSDIASADGNFLDPRCFKKNSIFPQRNNYRWPIVEHHTTNKDWAIWRAWLFSLCRGDRCHLQQPLGGWLVCASDEKIIGIVMCMRKRGHCTSDKRMARGGTDNNNNSRIIVL